MKIGFYIGEVAPESIGGGYTFQMNVLEAIQKFKTKHKLFFFYRNQENLFTDTDNIKYINLGVLKKKKKTVWQKLKKNINRRKETFNELLKKLDIQLMYFYAVRFEEINIPYFITVWDLAHREFPFFPEISSTFQEREVFYNKVLPRATNIIIGNQEGKREICKYYNINEDLVKIIPMITPSDVYILTEDKSILYKLNIEPQKYLYYPAQFWSHKNHIRLLKELKKAKVLGDHFKLVFSGSDQGNLSYIKTKVQEFNLEKNVIFTGFLKREEVISLYKNAFALTYASFFGPDNIPPLEAMACECPVICSEYKGAFEQLKNGVLYFNPLTGKNFLTNLEKLKNKKFRCKLIKRGREVALSYNTNNYVRKMFSLIDEFENYRGCWK